MKFETHRAIYSRYLLIMPFFQRDLAGYGLTDRDDEEDEDEEDPSEDLDSYKMVKAGNKRKAFCRYASYCTLNSHFTRQ